MSPWDVAIEVNWLELSAMAFLAQYGAIVLDDGEAAAVLQGVVSKLDQYRPDGADSLDFREFWRVHLGQMVKSLHQGESDHADDSGSHEEPPNTEPASQAALGLPGGTAAPG